MKQMILTKLIFLNLLVLFFTNCSKEFNTIIPSEWEVVKIKKAEDLDYLIANKSYVFKFIDNSSLSFKLDVNSCGSDFNEVNDKEIRFNEVFCTEACCDSEFAQELVKLLPDMTTYKIMGNQLTLEGQGEIVLRKL